MNWKFIMVVSLMALFFFIGCGVWAEMMVHGQQSKSNRLLPAIFAVYMIPAAIGLLAWVACEEWKSFEELKAARALERKP